MSKCDYTVRAAVKGECSDLLDKHHYLSRISKGFKSGVNFGLYYAGEIVGVCIFTGWPVPELLKGCFNLDRTDQSGFFELSRLVLEPSHQNSEHNLASWFISKSLLLLKRGNHVRCVLSYADDGFHRGTVYAASNFKYYGMTNAKKDFWFKRPDGSFEKHSRGAVKGREGEWRPRNQKHRFLIINDKNLRCNWVEQKWKQTNE